jgi:hypothetical protein
MDRPPGHRRRFSFFGMGLIAVLAIAIPAAATAVNRPPTAADVASELRSAGDPLATSKAWSQRGVRADDSRVVSLDRADLRQSLAAAPAEGTAAARNEPLVLALPAPAGGFERFAVYESSIMEPGLAAKHPEIKTYAGRGIDDAAATVRLDLSPLGLHASVRSPDGNWYIDPQAAGDQSSHVSYFTRDVERDEGLAFENVLGDVESLALTKNGGGPTVGNVLRTYRLALVTDPSYATYFGAANVTAAKVALMNRVTQIYEDETAIRMVLIADTDKLNLNTPALAFNGNGPCGAANCFTPGNLASCGNLGRIRTVVGQIIGASNYDIGHLALGNPGGGVASLGVVGGNSKAQGCTGLPNPVGDFYAVDYVAHEMGHQFAGPHTFNGNQVNCSGGNRSAGASVEPGSGSSIMAYAGICRQDDLQPHSDPYWSQRSFENITTYVTSSQLPINEVQTFSFRDFSGGNEVNVASVTGFSAAQDSYQLEWNGNLSAPFGLGGTAISNDNLAAAINGFPGFPGGAVVTGAGTGGFTVTYGGASAGTDIAPLSIVNCAPSCTAAVVETVKGGATFDSFTINYAGTDTAPIVNGTNFNAAGIQVALQGVSEVQTVSLAGFDADGDSYTLSYNGATSHPIVRGQNNTTAGIQNALAGGNEQQQAVLAGFSGTTQSFQIQLAGGGTSAVLGAGGLAISNANVAAAVNAIPGFAGTVTSAGAGNGGFTLTFAGASAGLDIPAISIVNCTGTCTSTIREVAKGAAPIAGWPAGGTVAVGSLTDAGYTLTFSGGHQGSDVAEVSVTNGTGGVTGTVAETTKGTKGALPVGATATVAGFGGGGFDGTGFQVTFGSNLGLTNQAPLSLTNVNGFTWFVGETARGGPIDNNGWQITPTGNTPPEAATPMTYTIPYRTPFALTGEGSDADGDTVTYLWEQNNIGAAAVALINPNKTTGPLFRQFGTALDMSVYDPLVYNALGENSVGTDPTRTFPDLAQILAGNTNAKTGDCPGPPLPPSPPTGGSNIPQPQVDCYSEFLPTSVYPGPINFRMTVRDGSPGGGGVASSDTIVSLAPGTGPFLVTSQSTPAELLDGLSTQTVTWDVAGTDAAPISATNVKISLSADGGFTYPFVLAASTPNDGSADVALANVATTKARIKVEGVGNVFFDVSDADFAIRAKSGIRFTGRGDTVVDRSAGAYAADPGTPLAFDFDARNGRQAGRSTATVTFRSNGKTYEAESNRLEAVGAVPGFGEAFYTAKLSDVTNPRKPVRIGTEFTLRISGADASPDTIGVTLWDGSMLAFSSRWTGATTPEQPLRSGNVTVEAG